MAMTMKNAVFCDIRTKIVPHRRHILHERVQPVNAM
jgi:hypothetical protein